MRRIVVCAFLAILSSVAAFAQTGVSNTGFPNYSLYRPPNPVSEIYTQGNPFLFDTTWARARVVAANNEVVESDSIYYNFDKVSQNLIITEDFRKIYTVDKREFKSVTFYWHDSVYEFEHVHEINKNDFFQNLVRSQGKYALYKWYHTTLKPGNYHNNGLASDGTLFEKYVDEPAYYIMFPNGEYRVLNTINGKSIQRIFHLQADEQKVLQYLKKNPDSVYTEDFLLSFVSYLNQ